MNITELLLGTGIATSLAMAFVQFRINRALEKYKMELKSANDVAIAHLRSDLVVKQVAEEVTQKRVDARVSEALEKMFGLLQRLKNEAEVVTTAINDESAGGESAEDLFRNWIKFANDLFETYQGVLIYIPEKFEAPMLQYMGNVRSIVTKHKSVQRQGVSEKLYLKISDQVDALNDEAAKILHDIKKEIRTRLKII